MALNTDCSLLSKEVKMRLESLNEFEFWGICNISFVPEEIRKSKEEAYIPQVVSIGPLHKGTRKNLLYMEQVKWRCMNYLLGRAGALTDLDELISSMFELDEAVRASYNVDEIKFNRSELAKIMLLDGCFLLELIICGSQELSAKLLHPSSEDLSSPGEQIRKKEKVLSDLTMLENQIPFFVLTTLFRRLFPPHDNVDDIVDLTEHALFMLGYGTPASTAHSLIANMSNLVEVVHTFVDENKYESHEVNAGEDSDNVVETTINLGSRVYVQPKLHRCATRLQAAGITMEPLVKIETIIFDLKIKFSNGKLEIPHLHITETTEARWRNLIAYEVINILDKYRGKSAFLELMGDGDVGISCQFISYARFFQSLICCVHDVRLLRERRVLVLPEDKNAMSDEDVLDLFRKITEGVSHYDDEIEMDRFIGEVIKKLNSHTSNVHCATETSRIFWHVFRSLLTWIWCSCIDSYRVLIRDYIPSGWRLVAVLAAAAGLALTAAQTVFSARGH